MGLLCQLGSHALNLHAGFAAKAGLIAAQLAKCGLMGRKDVLDHDKGLVTLMAHGDKVRLAEAMAHVKSPWAIEQYGINIKMHCSSAYTHRSVDCAIALHHEFLQHKDVIKEIVVS